LPSFLADLVLAIAGSDMAKGLASSLTEMASISLMRVSVAGWRVKPPPAP